VKINKIIKDKMYNLIKILKEKQRKCGKVKIICIKIAL